MNGARGMLRTIEVYKVSHTHQEGNKCADWMTKWIRGRDTDVVFLDGFPLELRKLAEADFLSTSVILGLRVIY